MAKGCIFSVIRLFVFMKIGISVRLNNYTYKGSCSTV